MAKFITLTHLTPNSTEVPTEVNSDLITHFYVNSNGKTIIHFVGASDNTLVVKETRLQVADKIKAIPLPR